MEFDFFREIGELGIQDFICFIEKDNTAFARSYTTHYKNMLDIVKLSVICYSIAEIYADGFVYFCSTRIILFLKFLNIFEFFCKGKGIVKLYSCSRSKFYNTVLREVFYAASVIAGPFIDHGTPIISDTPQGVRGGQQIDVDVFTDPKSGKHYIYWGNGYMAGAELNDDMVSLKPGTTTVLTPQGGSLRDYAYREGTYVFYRKGLYYFLWSVDDTGSPNYHVAYGTSKSPLGPINVAEQPIVLKQDPDKHIYGPAHNSVLQLKGKDKWYIVYHRINKAYLNDSPGTHREVCIDELTFDKKGLIVPVVPTLNGPEPLK